MQRDNDSKVDAVHAREAFRKAISAWSEYTRLQEPLVIPNKRTIKKHRMSGEIAKIGLSDLKIVLNAVMLQKMGLEDSLDLILAHEVGHHVLAPGSLVMLLKMTSYVSNILLGRQKGLMVNLFTDILVNDHMHSRKNLPIEEIYKRINRYRQENQIDNSESTDGLWTLYMRTYEVLWNLPRGTLSGDGEISPEIERDARLAARTVRTFSRNWAACLKNLVYIFKAYIPEDLVLTRPSMPWFGDVSAGNKGLDKVWGFATMSDEELDRPISTKYDGSISDILKGKGSPGDLEDGVHGSNTGFQDRNSESARIRTPAEYLETLTYVDPRIDTRQALIQYYTELAFPHLVPFPKTEKPGMEPLPEGTGRWDLGDGLETLDYLESMKESPIIFPGITTRRRLYGETKGQERHREPIDIDIYIDTSGSMTNPATNVSYPTIAGFVLALSALRAGAAVQATSWSGPEEVMTTKGFTRNKASILNVLVHYFGGGTQFPLSILERYDSRKKDDPPVHLIVISDEGVDTMLGRYMKKDGTLEDGIKIIERAMKKGKGQGSLLLNINDFLVDEQRDNLRKLEKLGFSFYQVRNWKEVVTFARYFSKKHFGS